MFILDLPDPVIFDWDNGNRDKNLKHNVHFLEAEQAFFNKPLLLLPDEKHSTGTEQRYHALGETNAERKLFLTFTIRSEKIRVISARDMDKLERQFYEKAKTSSKI